MTPPFVEGAGLFLPTTPLTDEEASRQYRVGKRRLGRATDYVGSQLERLDAGAEKQLRTSEQLKRNKELGAKYTPVELALGGAGPPSKEAVKEAAGYAGEAAKFAVGDTPLEWATGALMGPGKLPAKLLKAGALASLHTPEAEGVLLNLDLRQPSRWDHLRRQIEKLRGEGRDLTPEQIFELSKGRMTMGPGRGLEAIYRPQVQDYSRLTRDKRPLSSVWRDPELYEDAPELKDYTIRRALSGELPPSTYGQFNPRERLVLVNPNVKNQEFMKRTVGHETGHALSDALGDLTRAGTAGKYKAEELDRGIADLQKYLPGLVDPDERARHAALAWRLRMAKGREPKDLYFRDIGEAHGRASEAAQMIPGAEPYSNPIVSRTLGKSRPTYDENEFARLMNPNSVVESTDLTDIIRRLKQTVGAK